MKICEIMTKPIRLIETFAGYGSQAMALKRLGISFEHYRVVEFNKYAIKSYNAVHGTNFEPMDIRNVKGLDLGITNTDKFTYILTYSFPCTDLSTAGRQAGMSKGSGTRSGLLWEVERLLRECKELPQILFMENVPQVHSKKNMDDFEQWLNFLESLGYKNYYQDLNAKDYGVAQSRKRCFMFSFLGDYEYCFPEPFKLNKTIKDYLEENVAEKYYIKTEKADKLIQSLIDRSILSNIDEPKICVDGTINEPNIKEIANCIKARYDNGISNLKSNGTLVIEGINQLGNIMNENGFTNPQCGRVYDINGCSPTLNNCGGGNHEPKIVVEDKIIVAMRGRNPDNPSDRTTGSPTEQRLEPNSQGICNTLTTVGKDNLVLENIVIGGLQKHQSIKNDGVCPTLTSAMGAGGGNIPIVLKQYRIRKLTPREYGRLMGVSDKDIDKMMTVNSNSQLYKQFGNSIVVDMMYYCFKNLFI